MIRRFFLDKTATITKGSNVNTGLNPILCICYGESISRGILHFDEACLRDWISDEGICLSASSLTFKLRMTNCFSLNEIPTEKDMIFTPMEVSKRACSFDLKIYELNKPFDEGRGFDFYNDMWITSGQSISNYGATWRVSSGITKWGTNGAYSSASTLVATQHFDFGNENLSIDITDYVKSVLNNEKQNNGLLIKFSDELEKSKVSTQQYVGFFTDHTNTFFHPVVEAIYDEEIDDNRANFCVGRTNKLYLYVQDESGLISLDSAPKCQLLDLDEEPVEVEGSTDKIQSKCVRKGVYCVEIPEPNQLKAGQMYLDRWSNMKLNDEDLDDIDNEFVVHPRNIFLQLGTSKREKTTLVPTISGIDNNEKLNRGEIRKVVVDFRVKYTTDKKELTSRSEWRLYVKDGNREINVLPYTKIDKTFTENTFTIYTQDLIPGKYYIDIKTNILNEQKYFKEVACFNIVSDITKKYY